MATTLASTQPWRLAMRRPVPLVVGSAVLACGLSVMSAMLAVVDGAMFRRLPYRDSDRLVELAKVAVVGTREVTSAVMTTRELAEWRRATHVFERVEAYRTASRVPDALGDYHNAIRAGGLTTGCYELLGIKPARGSGLRPAGGAADDQGILVSEEYWATNLGRDPAIPGRTLTLRQRAYTIVGVMPPSFRFKVQADVWIPFDDGDPTADDVMVLAKLRDGVGLADAQRAVSGFARRASSEAGGAGLADRRLVPIESTRRGSASQQAILALGGATVALVLLASCSVATLIHLRVQRRRQEYAVRFALGAGSRHLVGLIAPDLLIVAVVSGGTAIALTAGLLGLMQRVVPPRVMTELFAAHVPAVDLRLCGLLLLADLMAVLVASVLPGRTVARLRQAAVLAGMLGSLGRTTPPPTGRAMLTVQVGTAACLLVVSGLLLTGYARIVTADPGFPTNGLVYTSLRLSGRQFPTRAARALAVEQLLDALKATRRLGSPAVGPPPFMADATAQVRTEASPQGTPVAVAAVGRGYLDVVGLRVLEGRAFRGEDFRASLPVAMVDERTATRLWPGGTAVGRHFHSGLKAEPYLVVGVVSSVRQSPGETGGRIYYPVGPATTVGGSAIVARVEGSKGSGPALSAVRMAAHKLGMRVDLQGSVDELNTKEFREPRFYLLLAGLPALITVLVAMAGLFALLSEVAAARQHEMATRLALGATSRSLSTWLVGMVSGPLLLGLAGGVLVGMWLSRGLASVLYATPPADAATCIGVAIAWGVTAFAMAAAVAARSSLIDAVKILRGA